MGMGVTGGSPAEPPGSFNVPVLFEKANAVPRLARDLGGELCWPAVAVALLRLPLAVLPSIHAC